MRKKKGVKIISVVMLIIGIAMLYFNFTASFCTGWNIINPLCWIGSFIAHSIFLIGGIALTIAGILRLLFKK